jgi:hypothetical protein
MAFFFHSRRLESQGILARFRWQASWPRGRVATFDSRPSRFPFAFLFVGSSLGSTFLFRWNASPTNPIANKTAPAMINQCGYPSSLAGSRSLSVFGTTFRAAPAARGRGAAGCVQSSEDADPTGPDAGIVTIPRHGLFEELRGAYRGLVVDARRGARTSRNLGTDPLVGHYLTGG